MAASAIECERKSTRVFYRVVPSALAQFAAVLGTAELTVPGGSGLPLEVTV